MKKWIVYVLIITFAAGMAFAEEKRPWWRFGAGEPKLEQEHRGSGRHQRAHPQLTEEQREKMKAHREAVEKLTEAARAETDPVEKEKLITQLRAKLTEGAVKMHKMHRKRLEKAEAEVTKMKERLAEAEKNIDQKVEEHLQKLLSGERPEGAFHRKGLKPPVE